MIGMNRYQQEFTVGTRVISARDRRHGMADRVTFGEMRVETVTHVDQEVLARGDNALMTLTSDAGSRDVHIGRTSVHEEGPWKVVWTDPIPDDDQAALRIVADVLGLNAGYHKTLMLWITMREDDVCYAHQLWDHDEAVEQAGIPQPIGPFRLGASPLRVRGLGDVGPGDIVACLHVGAALENHLYEHTVHETRVLAYAGDPSGIPAALPWHRHKRSRSHLGMGDLAGPHLIEEAEDRAWAATQPSEAMVIAWEHEGYGGRRDVSLSIVHSSGLAFHNNDDPGPYLEASVPGPGLWMFQNATMHAWRSYEGEYDAEMDGDWRPATQNDIAEAFVDTYHAARDLMDRLDGVETDFDEETIVEGAMAQAVETARADTAETVAA